MIFLSSTVKLGIVWSGHYMHGYHFSGISGNLEVSVNLAKVREKSGVKVRSPGIFVVREI